ncbi:invertase [Pseudodesulfovibrio nedwellii]|uniref:Invertase n=1 Tax=Pseudodesulfovibrio nedwellii TaxID=2973072 RepID=A0ABM8AXB8_9BACT|nr:recombinase family protein [Pseudodesulfovibrio nedwellii]BDQ36157.1 invertase [Pseudodesulfovibrio nedwellii]
MGKAVAYVRVSTTKQDVESQENAILKYADSEDIKIHQWFKLEASSRKSIKERRIDELLNVLGDGDTLVVSELSRLGRSLSQIVLTIDELLGKGVTFVAIKQGMKLNGAKDITAKVQIAMFGLLAEIERDLISERTKMGLDAARAKGKTLGRPKGSKGKSKLDGREDEIVDLLQKGISRRALALYLKVAPPTLVNFIKSRNLSV